jgi:hypothetical protein
LRAVTPDAVAYTLLALLAIGLLAGAWINRYR